MKLYQRIRLIAKDVAGSETKLASRIGFHQRTLNGYLKESREHNLWPLLPKILELYPQINRDWLYFNEGEILRPEGGEKTEVRPISAHAVSPSEREAVLEREVAHLLRLMDSKDNELAKANKLIALYEKQKRGLQSTATSG